MFQLAKLRKFYNISISNDKWAEILIFRLGFINHDGPKGRYARENFVRRGRSNAGAL